MKWFGPLQRQPGDEVVDVPVGELCLHCDEPIAAGEAGVLVPYVYRDDDGEDAWREAALHYECQLRQVIGGVRHQRRECSCYGGSTDDDEGLGLTKREAAKLAVTLYNGRGKS